MENKNVALLVVCLIIFATLQPSTATLKEEWDSCYNKCCEGCTSSWLYYPCLGLCKTKCVPNLSIYSATYKSRHSYGCGSSFDSSLNSLVPLLILKLWCGDS
ncbi:unnamed protein product [Lupinus luteus]|uniref:Uncharacterized protein n=1 Tax=Lupinus luteus TaxID=3873 RepID=A0AAV1XWR0_LUPLU